MPQVAPPELAIHNVFLLFATELGLVGLTLFLCCFVVAIGGAIARRGPPELLPWRVGLLAIATFCLVIASFAPMGYVFPSMIPWLWAGIVLGGSGAGPVDELPMPELEHEQRPDRLRAVLDALDVPVQETLDRLGPEVAAPACDGIEQGVVGELAQLAAQPFGDRHAGIPAWARRGSRRGSSRAAPRRRPTFFSHSVHLEARAGSDGRELHELVVEQRGAGLERVSHRGDVHLHQQVVREVRAHVHLEHPVERIRGRRPPATGARCSSASAAPRPAR